ncbi:MAG: GNAT family N-acetyltransferase [Clostridia bacterium]|nr:GNAT family N-acetyltransferase [Clostridia bacterium]
MTPAESPARSGRVAESLKRYDNHDSRLPYQELMLEAPLGGFTRLPLPSGFRIVPYAPGDRDVWISMEQSAREFDTFEAGVAAWNRFFAPWEDRLPGRMFFVADAAGQKVATASAWHDVRGEDDGVTGWLHWVAVRRESQGLGLSKPLITHVLCRMQELGYQRAVIPTQTTTWLAVHIYLSLGFKPIPRNAERSREGWLLVRELTGNPALDGL